MQQREKPNHSEDKLRRWFAYFALALPAIVLPEEGFTSIHGVHFHLGWLMPGMDIKIGGFDDGNILHFQPSPVPPLIAILWTYLASLLWRVRRWAVGRPDWSGAFTQAALTSLYCALVFFFLSGIVEVIWEWRLSPMNWAALERALVFGRAWLPYLCALGAAGIFITLALDARKRSGVQRLAHLAFAFCFGALFWWYSSYLKAELGQLDGLIEIARKQHS